MNVGPWNVAARVNLGEIVEGGESVMVVEVGDMGSGTGMARVDEVRAARRRRTVYSPGAGAVLQTWSARCRMSMSTAHDEHLMVGSELMRSMVACRARAERRYQDSWSVWTAFG